VIGALFVHADLGGKTSWISFLAGTGAIVFVSGGAELDPQIFRTKWKEATVIGLVGFFGPFFWVHAIATTSALVGTIELAGGRCAFDHFRGSGLRGDVGIGFNVTDFGKQCWRPASLRSGT